MSFICEILLVNFNLLVSFMILLVMVLYPLIHKSGFLTVIKQGRWSVMSVMIIWPLFIVVVLRSFVHMWSISVMFVSVILVGFVISGLKEAVVKMLK